MRKAPKGKAKEKPGCLHRIFVEKDGKYLCTCCGADVTGKVKKALAKKPKKPPTDYEDFEDTSGAP